MLHRSARRLTRISLKRQQYTAQASDATAVNYSLKPNTGDASAFTINNNTGAVKFIKSPNYEAKLSYSFTIVATDQLGNISEQLVRLAVNNLDESAPTITSSGNAISAEGQAILYRAAADDSLDASAGINWRLEGPYARSLTSVQLVTSPLRMGPISIEKPRDPTASPLLLQMVPQVMSRRRSLLRSKTSTITLQFSHLQITRQLMKTRRLARRSTGLQLLMQTH